MTTQKKKVGKPKPTKKLVARVTGVKPKRPSTLSTIAPKVDYRSGPRIARKSNDPRWYTAGNKLAVDAGRLSFNNPLGQKVNVFGHDKAIPGILTIPVLPGPGVSTQAYSNVNVAANNIYSYVRHANSGHTNYDAQDLMLYLLAMDEAFMYFEWMRRLYGTSMVFSQKNRYQSDAILLANGVDPASIRANLANFRWYIKYYAQKIGAMCVPRSMPYFFRHDFLFSGLYTDGSTNKAQVYMYVPAVFRKYDEVSGAGCLVHITTKNIAQAVSTTANKWSFSDIIAIGNEIIDAIVQSEDLQIMSGDILKAFGADKIVKINPVSDDYTVVPTYDREVLSQIENAVCVSGGGNMYVSAFATVTAMGNTVDITQDPVTGALLYQPVITTTNAYPYSQYYGTFHYLNFHYEDPSPDDVMVASRLVSNWSLDATSKINTCISAGSEIALCPVIWSFTTSGGQWIPTAISGCPYVTYITEINGDNTAAFEAICRQQTFDWAPGSHLVQDYMGTLYDSTAECIDYENYTIIDGTVIDKLNETAILNEFNVPMMGSWASKS